LRNFFQVVREVLSIYASFEFTFYRRRNVLIPIYKLLSLCGKCQLFCFARKILCVLCFFSRYFLDSPWDFYTTNLGDDFPSSRGDEGG